MRTAKIFLLIYTLLIGFNTRVVCAPDPSLRTIFWLHGFNGSLETWQKYYEYGSPFHNAPNNYFPAGHYTFTYETLSGVDAAAHDAADYMGGTTHTVEDFAICHSMGGLTIRQIEAQEYGYPNNIDGYITVGTPNDGAFLAYSYQTGKVEQFFVDWCDEVIVDPSSTIFWLNAVLYIINYGPFTGPFNNDYLCQFFYNLIESEALQAFTAPATVNDLIPNSAILNELNDYESELPRIAIYGNESSPVHFRLIQSFVTSPSGLALNQVKDSDLARHMSYIERSFDNLANTCTVFEIAVFPPVLTPAFNPEDSPFAPFAGELRQAAQWIRQSESQWGSLICHPMSPPPQTDDWQSFIYRGPGSSQNQSQVYQELSDNDLLNQVFGVGSLQNCSLNNSEWWPYQIHEVTQFGICTSDGVVEASSADFLPNPTEVPVIEILGANHQQLVNHPTMTLELNKIMKIGSYQQFFRVN